MNTKKSLVAALAAAVVVSSTVAVSVAAVAPGATTDEAKDTQTVEAGKITAFHAEVNDVAVDAYVPADVIAAGEKLTFGVATVTNVDIETMIANMNDVATSEILDIYFLDEDGSNVSFKGVDVDVVITAADYDEAFLADETGMGSVAKAEGGKFSFKAPHFSYYALVKYGTEIVDPTSEPTSESEDVDSKPSETSQQSNANPQQSNGGNTQQSQTSQQGGVNTGDSTATVAVFGIIGAAALGTALVASKSKKHAK